MWINRLPYAPGPGLVFKPVYINYYPELFDSLRIIENIDFDTLRGQAQEPPGSSSSQKSTLSRKTSLRVTPR